MGLAVVGEASSVPAIARIEELVPGTEVINPAVRYAGNLDWHPDWPLLLPKLAGLLVFGDEDGSIGAGCIRELADAWWRQTSVAMLDAGGQGRELVGPFFSGVSLKNGLTARS